MTFLSSYQAMLNPDQSPLTSTPKKSIAGIIQQGPASIALKAMENGGAMESANGWMRHVSSQDSAPKTSNKNTHDASFKGTKVKS